MKNYLSGFAALALTGILLTGCGCTNTGMEPTILPTNQETTMPTTKATIPPTTMPATVPTTETPMLPTETGMLESTVPSGATNGTDATTGNRSVNPMPRNQK